MNRATRTAEAALVGLLSTEPQHNTETELKVVSGEARGSERVFGNAAEAKQI